MGDVATMPDLLDAKERAVFGPFCARLADAAKAITLKHFDVSVPVEAKPSDRHDFDPVTKADRGAERAIRASIEAKFPTHGIRGEEYGNKPGTSKFCWVLDPIDGTRAYISALPVWGTLIALTRDSRPVMGLMDQPVTGERFIGFGDEAYLYWQSKPRRKLQTRSCSALEAATIATTDVYLFSEPERQYFEALRSRSRLQRYGLDCYGYAALARGGLDLVIESGLEDYDIAALIPIVEGAGGIVTNWSGGTAWQGGQVLASGDARLHDEALEILTTGTN
jgi:histidinol-phosphatase